MSTVPIVDMRSLAKESALPPQVLELKAVLDRRGIELVYFATGAEACQYLVGQIPLGAQIMNGSSETIKSIGFDTVLNSGRYDFLRPGIVAMNNTPERLKLRQLSTTADYIVGGVNAISLTGEILCADGGGNRVASYAYGGGKVFLVAGVNKITPNLQAAFDRLRNRAAVDECRHLGRKTPCAETGVCSTYECHAPERQCGKVLIIENEKIDGRMTLVLIGETLGY
ncbi:MAG TPA: LUD domain-containing protein [Herbaspirillum sp.]